MRHIYRQVYGSIRESRARGNSVRWPQKMHAPQTNGEWHKRERCSRKKSTKAQPHLEEAQNNPISLCSWYSSYLFRSGYECEAVICTNRISFSDMRTITMSRLRTPQRLESKTNLWHLIFDSICRSTRCFLFSVLQVVLCRLHNDADVAIEMQSEFSILFASIAAFEMLRKRVQQFTLNLYARRMLEFHKFERPHFSSASTDKWTAKTIFFSMRMNNNKKLRRIFA